MMCNAMARLQTRHAPLAGCMRVVSNFRGGAANSDVRRFNYGRMSPSMQHGFWAAASAAPGTHRSFSSTCTPFVKKDNLSIFVKEDADVISKLVAAEIADLIRSKQAANASCVLGLATGSTPIRVYKELIRLHREEGLSLAGVTTFNLDEYYPMKPDAPQSYRHFMNSNLFNHVNIDIAKTHVPDGTITEDKVEGHCSKYEQAIRDAGGVDLQLLGLGRTGHIGFNEPGSAEQSRTRMVHLDPLTRKDAAKDFGGEDNVPTLAMTMGVASILDARRVVLVAFGQAKANIAARSFQGEITEQVTASFLQRHGNVDVYLDADAASELSKPA